MVGLFILLQRGRKKTRAISGLAVLGEWTKIFEDQVAWAMSSYGLLDMGRVITQFYAELMQCRMLQSKQDLLRSNL